MPTRPALALLPAPFSHRTWTDNLSWSLRQEKSWLSMLFFCALGAAADSQTCDFSDTKSREGFSSPEKEILNKDKTADHLKF